MKEGKEFKNRKKKHKQLLKELQSAEQGECSVVDNWETIDMKKQLHPIGHYINNREEMIRQLFTVIQGDRLKKMLPPLLKDMDLDDLKADCLIHLVGMSSKRIKAVLEGHELDVSSDESDTDTNVDSVISDNNKNNDYVGVISTLASRSVKKRRSTSTRSSAAVSNSGQILEDGCSIISGDDMLEIGLSNSELCDNFFESNDDSESPKTKKKKLKRSHRLQTQQQAVSSTGMSDLLLEQDCLVQKSVSGSKESDDIIKKTGDENNENKGKTLLEIIELEMRARAIRALLKHDDSPTASPSSSQQKQNQIPKSSTNVGTSLSNEIIDLTCNNDPINEPGKSNDEADGNVIVNYKENQLNENVVNIVKCDEQSYKTEGLQKNPTKPTCGKEQINLVSSDEEISNKQNENKGKLIVVDTSGDTKTSVAADDVDSSGDASGNSWAQRWLEKKSKDVKRMVTTSKMCTTLRNKLKKTKLNRSQMVKANEDAETSQQAVLSEFKGSIDEYNMLKVAPIKLNHQPEESQELSQKEMTNACIISSSTDSTLPEALNINSGSDTAETVLIETTQSEVDAIPSDTKNCFTEKV